MSFRLALKSTRFKRSNQHAGLPSRLRRYCSINGWQMAHRNARCQACNLVIRCLFGQFVVFHVWGNSKLAEPKKKKAVRDQPEEYRTSRSVVRRPGLHTSNFRAVGLGSFAVPSYYMYVDVLVRQTWDLCTLHTHAFDVFVLSVNTRRHAHHTSCRASKYCCTYCCDVFR